MFFLLINKILFFIIFTEKNVSSNFSNFELFFFFIVFKDLDKFPTRKKNLIKKKFFKKKLFFLIKTEIKNSYRDF